MRSLRCFMCAALALGVLTAGQAWAVNIVNNPGFENGTGVDADDWAELSGPAGSVTRASTMPDAGSFHALMEVDHVSNPAAAAAYFIEQVRPVGSIVNTENYDLMFRAKSASTDYTGIDMFYQIQWLDQDGSDGGGVKGETLTSLVGAGLNTTYQSYSLLDIDVPDGADSYLLRFQLAAGPVPGIANSLFVDEVSLESTGTPPPPPPTVLGDNVLSNPGFELGTGADADDWNELTAGPNGSVVRSTAMPNTDAHSAYISFDNSTSPAAGAYFIEQNLGANTITDDTQDYQLSFSAKVDSNDFTDHSLFAQVQWLDQDGSDGGGVKGETLQELSSLGLNTNYQEFTLTDLDVPEGADSYLVRFQISTGTLAGMANGMYIDDVSLAPLLEVLAGDFDLDGDVDFSDFNALANVFGQTVPPAPSIIDIDGSGTIDFADFNTLANNFGMSSSAPVPEPATAALLGVVSLAMLRRKSVRR